MRNKLINSLKVSEGDRQYSVGLRSLKPSLNPTNARRNQFVSVGDEQILRRVGSSPSATDCAWHRFVGLCSFHSLNPTLYCLSPLATLRNFHLISIATLIFFFAVLSVNAQESFTQTALADLANKTAVSFEPQAVAQNAKASFTTAQLGNFRQQIKPNAENRVVRLLMDEANGVVFGYELTVKPIAANKFQLTLNPLAADFVPPRFAGQKSSLAGNRRRTTLLTLPQKIENQIVQDADALTIDLLVHPQLEIKIADKIRVSASRERLTPAPNTTRDLTLDDLELAVKNLKLKLNDADSMSITKLDRAYSGSLLWLYLPPKGFFLLSLTPREGYDFRKVGTVSDNKITFKFKNDAYELTSDAPVLPVVGTWNLWVLHEPDFQPYFTNPPIMKDYEAQDNQSPPVKNPYELNGEMAKPNDKSGFQKPDIETVEQTKAPLFLPNVRVGAVKQIENILPNY